MRKAVSLFEFRDHTFRTCSIHCFNDKFKIHAEQSMTYQSVLSIELSAAH